MIAQFAVQGEHTMKHFDALGLDAQVNYDAPVKEYSVFKTHAKGVMHA